MAISHVAAIGSNGSKTTGTTLAVSATPGTQPAVGDLIIVACARDDIANEPSPPTGDSISDGHGNTYTRLALNAISPLSTDATGANSLSNVMFWCVLTSAWSGTTTVTWTHPSVDARGMQVEHFAPTSGYTIILQETATVSAASGSGSTAALVQPVSAGGLIFGYIGAANDSSTVTTGDADTDGGAWSSVTANAGTTGGGATTNIFVATQYKLPTTPRIQSFRPTIGTSSQSITIVMVFWELPPSTSPGFLGAGLQVASNTGDVTPSLPLNTQADDLLVMVIGGRPSSNAADGVTIAAGADGWAKHGSTSYVAVTTDRDLSVQVWYKFHDGSESAPTVSVNTVLAEAAALDRGYSAQILAFRNVNTSSPWDVASVTSNNVAAATWTPTGITTATNSAMALSVVATADDNALNFNTSQSFVYALADSDYDTSVGVDHAVGAAYKIISAAGSVTQPTWNQSVNGNDAWVGIATALKPVSSGSTINGVAETVLTFDGPAVGSRTVFGQAASSFAFAGPAAGTRETFGQAASVFVFAGPAVGTRETFGQAASVFVFEGPAVGAPTVAGQAASTFTFAAPAVGTRTVFGTAETVLVFEAPAVGATELTGTAETALVFEGPAVGTVEHPGAAETALTFAAPAVGTVDHPGVAETALVFAAPAVGSVTVFGAAETVLIFDASAGGTVEVFGVAEAVFVFDAPAVGLAEHPATITEPTSERRPDNTTSWRRPDNTTSERRPLAATSERRRSVPI